MGMEVRCVSCGRSWTMRTGSSVYLQLDLATQPCPYCEAYALTGKDVSKDVNRVETVGRVLPTPAYAQRRRPG